ncbi:metal-binding protein [Moraxella catarrhalis]|uniref:YbjQ family protein n=1 Tax=Moraxella catarrhalis TaxID=480 RepID=UPI000E53B838|nr:heavy metal-binding domain-containing protein [Moraxella catarrhalis]AXT98546.1 metal-binding protein [Moraxella catarrhalis]AZQ89614.1 heavy-metal-binding family protein [Moraxella catarrhalis]MCG6815801.1 heavy metal-binding domain-containing protein [Moraxella catarrhalis]MPW94358.1 YbjQ family protein [Moraxella catarrhalis]MPW99260.1 metal-binding protein [Moraxella catarrhalis]
MIKSLIWLVLVTTGWYFGARAERGHLKSLMADEQKYQHIQVSSERFYESKGINESILVVGSVVIAQDKFKQVVAAMLSLFGKNLTVYETLLDRARREVVLRAKRQANDAGCHALYGLRFEMTEVQGGVEILAYGVAVK